MTFTLSLPWLPFGVVPELFGLVGLVLSGTLQFNQNKFNV